VSTPEPQVGDPLPTPPAMQRRLDAESDAVLRRLVAASPADVEAWLTANVTNVVQARRVLLALALAVRHLYLKA